jgi:hypothetical protein
VDKKNPLARKPAEHVSLASLTPMVGRDGLRPQFCAKKKVSDAAWAAFLAKTVDRQPSF